MKSEPLSYMLIFGINVLNKKLKSYLACHVTQLVARKDSQPAYSINKPYD